MWNVMKNKEPDVYWIFKDNNDINILFLISNDKDPLNLATKNL